MASLSPIRGPERAVADLLGEVRELARRLGGSRRGPAGGQAYWAVAGTAGELKRALAVYRDEVMVRREWPGVAEAWRLAAAGQSRALIELDRAWGGRMTPGGPGEASLRVGRRQLARLRPLRDVRVVQRYLGAIAAGKAHGWHPMVFGVWLAVFGVPLRQGLVHYAEQTLAGLLDSVPVSAELPEEARTGLLCELTNALPGSLAAFLPACDTPLLALP